MAREIRARHREKRAVNVLSPGVNKCIPGSVCVFVHVNRIKVSILRYIARDANLISAEYFE